MGQVKFCSTCPTGQVDLKSKCHALTCTCMLVSQYVYMRHVIIVFNEYQKHHLNMKPDDYIVEINKMICLYFAKDEDEIQNRTTLLISLRTVLRTQPMSFVKSFIELNGLDCLLEFLKTMEYTTLTSGLHRAIIGCIKALLNNTFGRAHILAHPMSLNIIAQSLSCDNVYIKKDVLEILGAICLIPGGRKKVLEAMYHYHKYTGERTRFQSVIYDLDRNTGDYHNAVNLKTAIMSFINGILRGEDGKNHLEFRLHLRYEFLMLGIQPIIEKLKNNSNAVLDRHLNVFEMVRFDDERQLGERLKMKHVDTRSTTAMFEVLRKKLNFTAAYSNLQSILFHLLQLPFGNGIANHYWQLIDHIVQQICLQTKEGDPDVTPMEIDVKKVIAQLASENTVKETRKKIREVQKECDELASKLSKKEHECAVKIEEQEELMQTLQKIKAKLEKETLAHNETKIHLAELQTRLAELQQMVDWERGERSKLEHAVKTGSLPDDAKMGVTRMSADMISKRPVEMTNGYSSKIPTFEPASAASFASRAPCPPPPPLPPGAVPPPPCGVPPPPGVGLSYHLHKKNIPQPKQALKSFNWKKLSEVKVQGTIWEDIDESQMYRNLDLEEFETVFSAYQGNENAENDVIGKNTKNKVLSVIVERRAQNCIILLKKLKMTNEEIGRVVISMDKCEELPKDMCEQLLKYVPTKEEIQLLSSHEHEIDQMAAADRFLYEMSKIDHYEERLKCLYFKKKFNERMGDVKPKVEAVLCGSLEIKKSRYLPRLLQIILALGNYMNSGHRGGAYGFEIDSINRTCDTKSSIDKNITFLHYLALIVEKKFPELLKLDHELKHVKPAAKVHMEEVESDLNILRNGLKLINNELKYHKSLMTPPLRGDRFVSVMEDFMTVSAYNFSELEDMVTDMKQAFSEVAVYFAEGRSKPELFFGVFSQFLTSFHDACMDNECFRKRKEKEEQRLKREAELKAEREKQKKQTKFTNSRKSGGEFDELISALVTGDVFGDDIAKLKKTRRKPPPQNQKGIFDAPRERAIKAS
ncbi:hypothetical protein LSH36_635g01003 [Paralvinella palmiformis]|uniref:Disheveled-associated activator of morphogenesis 1 n=1 Tax=Paralvinella palmiformis TaxID=53620 RepID=A0AAD9MWX9_9ANNE|nr:hypothetical protein LSH36_635g01003 [Paralvinella palmiformis]